MKVQVFFCGILIISMSLFARPIRNIYLERDIPEASVVAVVGIQSVETTAKGVQFGQFRVDELTVSGQVRILIKGDYFVSQGLTFLHRKAAPSPEQTVIVNGFSSFQFQPGHNYLLVLNKSEDGRLQLTSPEAPRISEFSDAVCQSFPGPEKDSNEMANTVSLLFYSFMSENERPQFSLQNFTLLNQTRYFRHMFNDQDGLKDKIVERLVQIKDQVSDRNSYHLLHQYLTSYGDYRFLDGAVGYVLDETKPERDRCNAIQSWLRYYPGDQQVDACREIIRECQNDSVRQAAQTRLDALWNLPKEVEQQFLRLQDPSDESFSVDGFIEFLKTARNPLGQASAESVLSDPEKWNNIHQKIQVHLLFSLKFEHPQVRLRAARVLHHFNDNSGVGVLMADYSTEDGAHRIRVVEFLRQSEDKQAVPVLIKAVDDPVPAVRSVALSALGELGAVAAFDVIVKHLSDKEQTEGLLIQMTPAQAACYALGQLRTPQAIRPLIKALDDEDLQQQAVKALNEIRKNGFSSYVMDSAMKMESPAFSSRGGFGSRSYSLYFPEDPGDDVAKWKRWGAWYLLKDEQVNVRLYADWQTAPNGYTMTTVGIGNHHAVDLQSLKDHGDAVVVMLPEDQDHPLLRSLLNRLLYASVAKQNGHIQIPYYEHQGRPDIQQRLDKGTLWFFQDVEGNLIQGATVEVYLYKHKGPRIKLGTYKTDGSITRYAMMGNISDTEFIVSHPDYGRARAQVYRDYDKLYLCLPLVAKDSQAALRAVWGYIIDPDNEPVANVEVYCEHVRTLGEGLINADYDFCRARVLTDENGFFRYYMPPMKKHSPSKFGSLIPPKSQYSLRVEVPFDPLLFSFNGQIPNGEESTIMLQRKAITDLYEDVELVQEGNFHTFSFYNQNGKIEKQEELECVFVEIHRPDAPKIKLNMSHFKAGLKVPNGTYKATSWLRHAGENVHFDPLEVTDESPEELVFAMPMLTYTGRVSHAFTNEPMAGVFVIAMNSSSKGNLSMITDQEWEALHALDSNPSIHDPALKPVDKIYGFENIVRTGEDGRFEMLCPKGDTPYGFVFFEQNYIGLKHRRHELKPNEDGEMEIPAKTMYPAAKVFFQANTDDKRVSICPKWRINKNENPGWVAEFLKNDDRREKLFTYDKWIRRNEVQSVYVPAGVKLKLQLRTPYGDDLDDYTYPQTIFLSQGQTMDLGECSFVNNIRLYVKVVDVQGNPVEGVPVRKKIGRSYDIPSMSDAEGISEFMVPPGSGGEFAVTYWGAEDKSHKHLVESIPFQTIDRADEGTTYSFEISNEMVELLFGD